MPPLSNVRSSRNSTFGKPERFIERPAGTYTWIPFGGGVRRCLGASFALLEMKRVLQSIVREVSLRAAEPRSERVVRRSITLNPQHGTRVEVLRRTPTVDGAVAVHERAPQPAPALAGAGA